MSRAVTPCSESSTMSQHLRPMSSRAGTPRNRNYHRGHSPEKSDRAQSPHRAQSPLLPNQPESPARRHPLANSNAWHDVLALCKNGFASKMQAITEEILTDVRSEVQNAVLKLRTEVADIVATRENPLANKMSQILERMELVEKAISRDADVRSILTEMQGTDLVRSQKIEQRIEQIAQLSSQMSSSGNSMGEVMERLEDQVKRIESRSERAESMLDEVNESLSSLNAAASLIAMDVQKMSGENSVSQINTCLESQITESFERLGGTLSVDLEPVRADIYRTRKQVDSDFKVVLGEIARVQQALHLDFVQLIGDKVEKPVERVATVQVEVDVNPESSQSVVKMTSQKSRKTITDAMSSQSLKRVREIDMQTDAADTKNSWAQTDPIAIGEKTVPKRKTRAKGPVEEDGPPKAAFAGADAMKEKARLAAMEKQYNVFDLYYETGIAQLVAKSNVFEYITLMMIILNSIWIAVDTDYNDAAVLINADPIFQIAENVFCSFFFFELLVRFCAFRRKLSCFTDAWFVFDLVLVSMMVVETWIITIMLVAMKLDTAGGLGGMSMLRMVRMVKLLRLSRMAKILRAVPELVIIMKGIGFAARSVAVFMVLWVMIVYVFAVAFRQLTNDLDIGRTYFPTVPGAMNTLLMQGVFPENEQMVNDLTGAAPWMWPIIVGFIALVSVTVMYMLVGVLVDVVKVIATNEKEKLTVSYIASQLREELIKLGFNIEGIRFNKFEFEKLMVEPSVVKVVQSVGVDVVVMVDMLDMIFDDAEKKSGFDAAGMPQGMSFPGLVDVILNMRGSNPATVKDCKEQLRVMKVLMFNAMIPVMTKIDKKFNDLRIEMAELRDDINQAEDEKSQAEANERESGLCDDEFD